MNILNKFTLRTLGKNKVRTLVTIIGIILSASMITAVTTCVSSLRNFLINVVIEQDGDWHGVAYDVSKQQIDTLNNNSQVDSFVYIQNIGYALLQDSQNEYKPYLFVGGMSDNFADAMPVNLIKGKLPENPSEIILPKHLETNGNVKYSIGDMLTLSLGRRVSEGLELNQNDGLLKVNNEVKEKLEVNKQRTYTVVGFYERPGFENYSAPGYTALTVSDNSDRDKYDVYIKTNKLKNIYAFLEDNFPKNSTETHKDLLRYSGVSDDTNFNAVLYRLAAILIALIMFGSISLIYNAFSISLSERTKQFGLLSSVGATKRQMLRSVLFEAAFLSLIGIPLGILAGIVGIGVTLELTQNLFESFLSIGSDVAMKLSVSWEAVIAAFAIGIVTVLISAYIPARRALKVSAIDAIRQTSDIKIKARSVRTSKLTYKLYGLEGMLAKKNFKRNKRKYRATVISLFLSIVLFITASSFSAYLTRGVDSVLDNSEYDIVYVFTPGKSDGITLQELYNELSALGGIEKASYAYFEHGSLKIDKDLIDKDYIEYYYREFGENPNRIINVSAFLNFIEDSLYEEYLKENSLNKDDYLNAPFPKAIAVDFIKIYNVDEGRYYTFNIMNTDTFDVALISEKRIEGYYLSRTEVNDDGEKYYIYKDVNNNGTEIRLTAEEAVENYTLPVGAVVENKPFCVDYNYGGITLIYPYSAMDKILNKSSDEVSTGFYFKANKDHKALFNKIYNVLVEKELPTSQLYNVAESAESRRALVSVINIFSYGFITLISLIAAANVFNTISTNIGLRRREFAMLKSVGMTQKGFNKMMNFECFLYGFKGLIYGLPVSIGITYLIYRSIESGWETKFFIPWHSIVIAVGSVFAVVFSTMVYSMSKIRKDNVIDALKNENL